MPTVTRAQRRKTALNLLQLPDEILSVIVQFTFDPVPVEEAVAHVAWSKRKRFDNQSLLALSLTHSKLRALASFWLTRYVYFAGRPGASSGGYSQPLLTRYKNFGEALSARLNLVNEIQYAFLEEPARPMRGWFRDIMDEHLSKSTSLRTLVLHMQDPRYLTYYAMFDREPAIFTSLETLVYSNTYCADTEDVLQLFSLQSLRFLAVDIGTGELDDDFNEWEGHSDVDAAEYDPIDFSEEEEDIDRYIDSIKTDERFAKNLRTFKCFVSDGSLPILLFKVLLPRAHRLTEIGLNMRSFHKSRKLKHLKTLLHLFNSEGKQLKKLSLSAEQFNIRGEMPGFTFNGFDRLKILVSSSTFVFGQTQLSDIGSPKYDLYIYKRLPPNLEELHLTFNDTLGLVRDLKESFLEILYGKCKCEDTEDEWEEIDSKTMKKKAERIRQANFQQYWHDLVLDIHYGCENTTWLMNLVQQRKEGSFRSLKKIVVEEDSDKIREIYRRSGFDSETLPADRLYGLLMLQINQHGLCKWLELADIDVKLSAFIFAKLEEDALQILGRIADNLPLEQGPLRKSPFTCSKCQEDNMPYRYQYDSDEDECY